MGNSDEERAPKPRQSMFTIDEAIEIIRQHQQVGDVRPKRKRLPTVTKESVPWRSIAPEQPLDTVLSKDDIDGLASVHQISSSQLHAFFEALLTTFRGGLTLSQPELTKARHKRGQKNLRRLNDLLRHAEGKLDASAEILDHLTFGNPFTHAGTPNQGEVAKNDFEKTLAELRRLRSVFQTMEKFEQVSYLGTPERTKATDVLRKIVCTHVFNLWADLGRKLSYTTMPDSGERTGPLVILVQDVVLRLTDPPTRLSGESIKRELEMFRRDARS